MTEYDINLKALKKVDPYTSKIEASCSNVALYNFNSNKAEWEKTEIEGTLFLFQREAHPKYGFTIMNRLNPENHIEPVTGQLDFQIQAPFLLYKNSASEIRGIWFYSKDECQSIGKKIQVLVKEVEQELEKRTRKLSSTGAVVDLSQLLQNADRKRNLSPQLEPSSGDTGRNLLRLLSQPENTNTNGSQVQPTTTLEQNTSVKDFFARATSSQLRSTPQLGEPVNNGSVQGSGMPGSSMHNPVGQVMVRPVSNFPQPVFGLPMVPMPISQGLAIGAVPVPMGGFSPYAANPNLLNLHTLLRSPGRIPSPLLRNPGALTVDKIEEEQRKSSSPVLDRDSLSPAEDKQNVMSLGDLSSQLKQQLFIGGNSGPAVDQCISGGNVNSFHQGHPLHLLRGQEGGPKLLSPQVFSSSVEQAQHLPGVHPLLGAQGRQAGPGRGPVQFPPGEVYSEKPSITPLTRRQMLEALEFLLANDERFVEKLHEAYIHSLSSKFRVLQ